MPRWLERAWSYVGFRQNLVLVGIYVAWCIDRKLIFDNFVFRGGFRETLLTRAVVNSELGGCLRGVLNTQVSDWNEHRGITRSSGYYVFADFYLLVPLIERTMYELSLSVVWMSWFGELSRPFWDLGKRSRERQHFKTWILPSLESVLRLGRQTI